MQAMKSLYFTPTGEQQFVQPGVFSGRSHISIPSRLEQAVLVIAAIPLFLASCCDREEPGLAGTSWQLEQGSSYTQVSGLGITTITLSFGTDESVTGTHAYLTYGGRYSASNDTLTVTAVAWTCQTCQAETGVADQQAFLDTLMSAQSYSIRNNRLVINTADGELVFERLK